MTQIFRYSIVAIVMMFAAFGHADAQKFGYTSSQAILAGMPDVKQAESKLEALGKQLQTKGEQLVQAYQKKRADLEKRYNEGTVSQVELERELEVLGKEEQKIMAYEEDMMTQLSKKRTELIQPILDKVKKAIDDVAAEQGYQYIFDQGTGVLLYAKEEDDITPAVKKKLGL